MFLPEGEGESGDACFTRQGEIHFWFCTKEAPWYKLCVHQGSSGPLRGTPPVCQHGLGRAARRAVLCGWERRKAGWNGSNRYLRVRFWLWCIGDAQRGTALQGNRRDALRNLRSPAGPFWAGRASGAARCSPRGAAEGCVLGWRCARIVRFTAAVPAGPLFASPSSGSVSSPFQTLCGRVGRQAVRAPRAALLTNQYPSSRHPGASAADLERVLRVWRAALDRGPT